MMMEKDTMKRITAREALEHPFLQDANNELEQILRVDAPLCELRLL